VEISIWNFFWDYTDNIANRGVQKRNDKKEIPLNSQHPLKNPFVISINPTNSPKEHLTSNDIEKGPPLSFFSPNCKIK
jgi:hypothetical protein